MRPLRIHLDRDVAVVLEAPDGVELEGSARLCPGRMIELIEPGANGAPPVVRAALVWTWALARVGADGLVFRGFCRWRHAERP